MKIRVILTDAMDVLFYGFTDLAKALCARDDETRGEEHYQRYINRRLKDLQDLCRGNISEIDFWKELDRNGRSHDAPLQIEHREICRRAFRSNMRRKVKGTFEIYKKLMSSYKTDLFLASDHVAEIVPQLIEWHPEVFDAIPPLKRFWSYDIGLVKRDPEFFPYVLSIMENNFEVKKEEILFIDDSEVNIEMARRNGIEAIRFESAEQLARDLKAYGFKV